MVVAVDAVADAALVAAVVVAAVGLVAAVAVAGTLAAVVMAMASLLRAATGARAGAGRSAHTDSYALAQSEFATKCEVRRFSVAPRFRYEELALTACAA